MVLARATAWLDRAAFSPTSLPDDLVTGIAFAPCLVAGVLIYRGPALLMLAVAVIAGGTGELIARRAWRGLIPRPQAGPLIAAVVGIALIGAGAPLAVSIASAISAVLLELGRARYLPAVRAQVGLFAYAAVALAFRGGAFIYLNPVNRQRFGDPISIWYRYFAAGAAPIDPIRLYVGNVPGPAFATSLLAVAIGVAWLWYARRLSLVVLIAFAAGAVVPIVLFRWDFLFQLDSGPTWFVAGLLLADRRLLPGSWALRPVIGFGAGLLAVGLRAHPRGFGIEAALFTVAGFQAVMAVAVAALVIGAALSDSIGRSRRLRERQAQLRVIEGMPRTG